MKSLQNLSYKTLFTILFLALAGIVFLLKIGGKTQKVSAAWWDDSWHYRKAITITENTGIDINNLPIKLSISGLSNKAQTDCDDIRVTDINGNLINSQIETCDTDNTSTIWIQDNVVANIQKTYYIYYGNQTASAPNYNQTDPSLSINVNSTSFQIKNSFVDLRGNTTNTSGAIRNLIDVTTGLDSAQINDSTFRIDYHYESALGGDAAGTGIPSIINDGPIFKQIGWTEAATSFSVNRTALVFNNFPIIFQRYQITNNSASSYSFTSSHHSMTESGRCYNFSADSRCSASEGDSVGGDSSHGWFIDSADNIGMCKIRSSNLTTSTGWRSYGAPSPTLTLDADETSGWYEYYLSTITSSSQCDSYANIMYTQQIDSIESDEEAGGGPIAYWKFDEGEGTTAYNSAENILNASVGSTNWVSEESCVSGKCIQASGTVSYNPKMNITSNVTYNIWAKITAQNPDTWPIVLGRNSHLSYSFRFNKAANNFYFEYGNGSCNSTTWGTLNLNSNAVDSQWHMYTMTQDGTTIKVYLDAKLVGNASVSSFCSDTSSPLYLSTNTLPGFIDEAKIYPYARTADQIKQDYNSRGSLSGSSANLGVQSNTAPSLKDSLIAYYKFDENNGTTAYDSSNNNNTAIITDSNWSNSGKFNKAISLGSTNAIITSNAIYNNTQTFTLSAYIYPTETSSFKVITGTSIGNNLNSGLILQNNNLCYHDYSTNSSDYSICSTDNPIVLNKWQHVTLTYDNGIINLYVDGKNIKTASFIKTNTNNTLVIGRGTGYYSNRNYIGLIDEVKVYNKALTANEVKQDYNYGSSVKFGSTTQNIGDTTTSLDYCIPGDTNYCAPPVVEWKMDEGIGTSTVDTSGNNKNGTLNNSPSWVQGKKGKALNFSTTNNSSVTTTFNTQLTSYTAEAWIKPSGFESGNWNTIMAASSSYPLWFSLKSNGEISTHAFTSSTSTETPTNGANIQVGNWYHIVVSAIQNGTTIIYVNGIGLTSFTAGNDSWPSNSVVTLGDLRINRNLNFNGSIDQVKIYDYIRTPAQVAYDYNRGGPVGWWKMDECQGSTIYDWSGNGNNGTLTIGSNGTQNSIGTCQIGTSAAWTNGATGKFNSSLNFDGTDDRTTLPNDINLGTQELTISAWVKHNSWGVTSSSRPYVSDWNTWSVGSQKGFILRTYGTNQYPSFSIADGTNYYGVNSSKSLTLNTWYHVTGVFKANSIFKIYVNGTETGSGSAPSQYIKESTTPIYIGYGGINAGYFDGQIDDVRIYNYALTSEQVKTVYNNGAVNFN